MICFDMTQSFSIIELRKQARHLENEIDLKLVSFSKVGTSLGSRDFTHENSDTVPLLSSAASGHVVDSMTEEIEHLLSLVSIFNFEYGYPHRNIFKIITRLYSKNRNNKQLISYKYKNCIINFVSSSAALAR